ncbi:DUF983 domain-containing protein [Azospirillum picis]|uniref:Uncharacterized protein (DUF983 family) n=1 Tax=Azospirillum picis TaxID=488438 RepID=A0ABU0MTV2_9PROT|nr:DUF983 domain-containing protein [Azospirillum picis]MBP2303130.1 uncharacterized protein (DUF983 family) [Azospirillum picis]MDQ0536882.1 uncharacterized protein (DUF983 family) [Azospirillum picis]
MSDHHPPVSPAAAGLRCVCPRCGRGRLFDGYLTVAERCGVCGLDFSKVDSGDGPAVFLIFILGFLVVPVALWVSMNVDWPLWLHAIVWSIVVLALTLGMLRPAKAYVVALQYRYRRSEVE